MLLRYYSYYTHYTYYTYYMYNIGNTETTCSQEAKEFLAQRDTAGTLASDIPTPPNLKPSSRQGNWQGIGRVIEIEVN